MLLINEEQFCVYGDVDLTLRSYMIVLFNLGTADAVDMKFNRGMSAVLVAV